MLKTGQLSMERAGTHVRNTSFKFQESYNWRFPGSVETNMETKNCIQ
jgi:hypothetical protein